MEQSFVIDTGVQMREFGGRIAAQLRAGDLLVLTGDLGAGKTTFTQGLGAALGVRGHIVSPTFTISREYPSLAQGPTLVHVDAYRLGGSFIDLDALDLDSSLDDVVTVIEWGEGIAEVLSEDRLEITISRPRGVGGPGVSDRGVSDTGVSETGTESFSDEPAIVPRYVTVQSVGDRWSGVQF